VKILEVPTNLQQDLHMAIIFVLLDQDEMRFFVGELPSQGHYGFHSFPVVD
jgi:hypothetical protein